MSFKICIIGCGYHSRQAHGPSLARYAEEYPGTLLAGCCDIDESKANSYKENFGFCRAYTDIDKMLENEAPDAISVVLPEALQYNIAMKIIKKQIPLLLEKPPGNSLKEAISLDEAVQKQDVPNMVAFNRRYHPINMAFKDILEKEYKPEDIQNIHYEMYRCKRAEDNFWATAIHGIDLIRHLSGSDFRHIDFFYQDFPDLGAGVSNIYMFCTFKSGATAQLSFCPVTGMNYEKLSVNVYGNTFKLDVSYSVKGILTQYSNTNQIVRVIKGGDLFSAETPFEYCGYYHENELFFNCIRNKIRPGGDIHSCLQSMETTQCLADRKTSWSAS